MENDTKPKSFKRKRKRKQQSEVKNNSFVRPELFDGMSNWLNLQKVGTLLSVKSQFVWKILAVFSFIPSFLFAIVSSSFHHILPSLSFIYEQVGLTKTKVEKRTRKVGLTKKKVLPPESKKVSVNAIFKGKSYSRAAKKQFKANKKSNPNSKDPEEKTQPDTFAEKKSSHSSMEEISENIPSSDGCIRLTKTVAMDCEMVGTGSEGKDSIIARVSIVNSYSECIYDEHVKPKERVTDYRTEISGVRPADLRKGKELYDVQQDVLSIIKDRRVVGHDLKHDFDVLFISHPKNLIRDTARYKPFREISGGRTPSLKKLASVLLGCDIQGAEHSSVEDAQAAMLLYLRHKGAWEKSVKPRRKR